MIITDKSFFDRDCLELAPDLVGKIVAHKLENGETARVRLTETEAYRGAEDTACHASKGRTPRSEILYHDSGTVYIYLCYGMHWLMNIVSGGIDNPQAVLLRSAEIYNGPGKLTKHLAINKSLNDVSIISNPEIWLEDDGYSPGLTTAPRVGIDYATDEYKYKPWRFIDVKSLKTK